MSMVKRSDQAVHQAVCDVAKGSFKGGARDARHQGERGRARVPGAAGGRAQGALEAARRGPGQAQGAQGAGRIGEDHGQAVTAVELLGTVKRFGPVTALDGVDLRVARGEVHAVVGENGAGKTTLMSVLAGVVAADAGEIRIHGEPVRIDSVEDAYGHGIGMVHQHFRLFRELTVAENVAMGREPRRRGGYDHAAAEELVAELGRRHGLRIDPRAKVGELSVGDQQRVEILRALHRAADVLILDEPTAVLTPQETEGLFAVARELAAEGRTVLFISHKLREVLEVSDTVTVMRRGQVTGTRPAAETDARELTRLMVGRAVHFDRVEPAQAAGRAGARAARPLRPRPARHRPRGARGRDRRRRGRRRQRPDRAGRDARRAARGGGGHAAHRRRGAHGRERRAAPRGRPRLHPRRPLRPRPGPGGVDHRQPADGPPPRAPRAARAARPARDRRARAAPGRAVRRPGRLGRRRGRDAVGRQRAEARDRARARRRAALRAGRAADARDRRRRRPSSCTPSCGAAATRAPACC